MAECGARKSNPSSSLDDRIGSARRIALEIWVFYPTDSNNWYFGFFYCSTSSTLSSMSLSPTLPPHLLRLPSRSWMEKLQKCIAVERFASRIISNHCGPGTVRNLVSLMQWHLASDPGYLLRFRTWSRKAWLFIRTTKKNSGFDTIWSREAWLFIRTTKNSGGSFDPNVGYVSWLQRRNELVGCDQNRNNIWTLTTTTTKKVMVTKTQMLVMMKTFWRYTEYPSGDNEDDFQWRKIVVLPISSSFRQFRYEQ